MSSSKTYLNGSSEKMTGQGSHYDSTLPLDWDDDCAPISAPVVHAPVDKGCKAAPHFRGGSEVPAEAPVTDVSLDEVYRCLSRHPTRVKLPSILTQRS
jgi:hypothetical protein